MAASIIYFVQRADGAVKIGTTINLSNRLSLLKSEYDSIKLLGTIKGNRVKERLLHWCLSDARLDGEWFDLTNDIQKIIDEYAVMPKKREKKNPRRHIQVILPEDEADLIRQRAKEANQSISKYVRERLNKLNKIEAMTSNKANGNQ